MSIDEARRAQDVALAAIDCLALDAALGDP
jgi:hypothetical protein